MDQDEVVVREEQRPACLTTSEMLCCAPELKVAMIGDDLERLRKSLEELALVFECLMMASISQSQIW